MPLKPSRPLALKSSIDAYGKYRTFCPFTFISNALLPDDGMIETTVCAFASSSRTTSPARSARYAGAAA